MRGISIALIALFACSSETGVMLVISTNDAALTPDEIIVFVGEPTEELDGVSLDTFNDPKSDRFDVEDGRNLKSDPVRYFIRPGEGGVIKVAAVGLGAELDAPLTAHYDDSLEFAPDVVLEVKLVLEQGQGESFDECSLCFRSDGFQIASPFDADCDLSRPAEADAPTCEGENPFTPPDCDDHNAARNANLIESCDGFDNDCDQVEQFEAACFIMEADQCQIGTQVCSNGLWSDCMGEGDPDANPDLCVGLSECQASDDPIECFINKHAGRVAELDCEISIAATADNSEGLCSAGVLMNMPMTCEQMVVLAAQGPPNAAEAVTFGLQGVSALPGATQLCEGEPATIQLGASKDLDRGARLVFLETSAGVEESTLRVINLIPKYVESCGDGDIPVSCVNR